MVTQIQLGNLFTSGGKQVIGGGASGIDTEALVKGLTEARLIPAKKLQDRIDLNDKKASSFSEMRQILVRLQDASNFLRNPPGVGNEADNIFNYRSANVTSNSSTSASSYLSVTVQPGATNANYVVDDITAIALAKKQETGAFVIANQDTAVVSATPAAGEFGAGTVTINGQNITLSAGDTLRTVAKKFNDVSSLTGIAAQVFQVSPGQFKLIYTSTKTGLSSDFNLSGAPTVTADPSGVLTNITFATTQNAQNAQFQIDNVAITRESNVVTDLVDGVTFTLIQDTNAAPATKLDVKIVPDTEIIQKGITNFVNAYNDFRLFVSRQTQLKSDGTPQEDSILFNSTTMRSTLSRVSSELSRVVSGLTAGDPNRLSELGITFTNYPGDNNDPPNPPTKNILTIDSAKLKTAIESNFDSVRKVFEFDFSSDSNSVQVFKRTNSLSVSDFTMNIDPNGLPPTYTATYDLGAGPVTVNLTATALSGGTGYTLSGQDGTALAGLVMIYTGSATSTVNAKVSQGIGDRLFNTLEDVIEDTTGALSVDESQLTTANERFQTEIDRINEQVDRYRERLLKQYADLEAAISKVNNILQSLDAQAQARAGA
jgi:flagellar hook-associated protein 2